MKLIKKKKKKRRIQQQQLAPKVHHFIHRHTHTKATNIAKKTKY